MDCRFVIYLLCLSSIYILAHLEWVIYGAMSKQMSVTPRKEQGKSYSIIFDYLRVFAMLGVLAVHLSQQFPMPRLMKEVAGMGAFCVQIFFVISAYLGCSYFFRPGATIGQYYRKRALRILPTYYAAIVAAMVYIEFFTKGYNADVFHLGWLRYFLGLNTILPSVDFWQWNNTFGFWTMTNFIVFYAIIPMVIKFVDTWRKSVAFFLLCYIAAVIVRLLIKFYISGAPFHQLDSMLMWSPLVQMQHFALGMMTYFAVRDSKTSLAAIMLISMAMLPRGFCSLPLLFAILTCLFIISVKERDVNIMGAPRKCLQFVAKYSFHVYLTHLLALAVGQQIAVALCAPSTVCFYMVKLFVFIVATLLFCCFLELAQRTANKMFS